jgi:hypothetical protein
MKRDVNSLEVHLQLSHNGHPVDGVLVGAGSLWPICVVPSGDQLATQLGLIFCPYKYSRV